MAVEGQAVGDLRREIIEECHFPAACLIHDGNTNTVAKTGCLGDGQSSHIGDDDIGVDSVVGNRAYILNETVVAHGAVIQRRIADARRAFDAARKRDLPFKTTELDVSTEVGPGDPIDATTGRDLNR